MCDDTTPAEIDQEYLLRRRPESTEDECEMFMEKVSIFVIDAGMEDKQAREEVFKIYFG